MFEILQTLHTIWGHPLSTYAKFSEKLTFLTLWCATRIIVAKFLDPQLALIITP